MLLMITALIFFSYICAISSVESAVPASNQFKHVNQGPLGEYSVEYAADYRTLPIGNFPFQLCFYNTTSNAYLLALRMGSRHTESTMLWVWEANRGRPVGDGAALSLGPDGNLVLTDADGRVAWQTGTANRGVVGLDVLSNGNIVLRDRKGRFVWQSFDHPTDTLLVGQVLRRSGPSKLVSRASFSGSADGAYSLVMEPKRLALYVTTSPVSNAKPLLYYDLSDIVEVYKGSLDYVAFHASPETEEANAYEVRLDYSAGESGSSGASILSRPKYNATYSFLRIDYEGNLKVRTFYEKVDWGSWETTFTLFSRDGRASECQLPTRCGALGVCEDDQCVACPRPQGLVGWSKACSPPALGPCKGGKVAGADYYQVVGVEHFMSRYERGAGPMSVAECKERCSKDCKCAGFFYKEESSRCFTVPVLATLIKVDNASHVAYIKLT